MTQQGHRCKVYAKVDVRVLRHLVGDLGDLVEGFPLVVFFLSFNRLHDVLSLVRTLVGRSWRNAGQNVQTFRSKCDAALRQKRQQKTAAICNHKKCVFASTTVRVFDVAETQPCKRSRDVKYHLLL